MSARPAQPTLLGLPIELRLQIYEGALQDDEPLPCGAIFSTPPSKRWYRRKAAVNTVCQQVNAELTQHEDYIRLRVSTFRFDKADDLGIVIRNASERALAMLTSVSVSVSVKAVPRRPMPLRIFGRRTLLALGDGRLVVDKDKLAPLALLPKLQHLCIFASRLSELGGTGPASWTESVRDKRYAEVMKTFVEALPPLHSGVRLEVQCTIQCVKGPSDAGDGDRTVQSSLRYKCNGAAGWEEVEVEEMYGAYSEYVPFHGKRKSRDRERLKVVWRGPETVVRRR
ncbi:hypothetical protein LTR85_006907 [Meristemomyces frigidus]|nr:hypothetical protein LTR85_006907 [Meristemomyces frigidus]